MLDRYWALWLEEREERQSPWCTAALQEGCPAGQPEESSYKDPKRAQLCGDEGQSSVTETGGKGRDAESSISSGVEWWCALWSWYLCKASSVVSRLTEVAFPSFSAPVEGPETPHQTGRGLWARWWIPEQVALLGMLFHIFLIQPGSVSLSSVPQYSMTQASLLLDLIIIIRKYNSELLGQKIFK